MEKFKLYRHRRHEDQYGLQTYYFEHSQTNRTKLRTNDCQSWSKHTGITLIHFCCKPDWLNLHDSQLEEHVVAYEHLLDFLLIGAVFQIARYG